jgi:predicted Zn-dependent protease
MTKKDILATSKDGDYLNKYVIGKTSAMHIHVKKELKNEVKYSAGNLILNEFVAELIENSFKEFLKTAKIPKKMSDIEKQNLIKHYTYNIEKELIHDKDVKDPSKKLIKIIHLYVVPEFQSEIKSIAARYSIKMNTFLAVLLIDGLKAITKNKQAKN